MHKANLKLAEETIKLNDQISCAISDAELRNRADMEVVKAELVKEATNTREIVVHRLEHIEDLVAKG